MGSRDFLILKIEVNTITQKAIHKTVPLFPNFATILNRTKNIERTQFASPKHLQLVLHANLCSKHCFFNCYACLAFVVVVI